jgi:hypothetical protein
MVMVGPSWDGDIGDSTMEELGDEEELCSVGELELSEMKRKRKRINEN